MRDFGALRWEQFWDKARISIARAPPSNRIRHVTMLRPVEDVGGDRMAEGYTRRVNYNGAGMFRFRRRSLFLVAVGGKNHTRGCL